MKVVAALSGGVDSAVAAARAVDAGHHVVGIHLALVAGGSHGCCSLDDARDARRVADVLGIAFYAWDFAEEFQAEVVDDFVREYADGRTPNPCVRCNERIKFAAVLDRSVALGFDAVVTGHYARRLDGAGGPELHRARDAAKDQSYVLAGLVPAQLARVMFPLGDSAKSEVRAEAARRSLGVAAKPDSHDTCFIGAEGVAGFLAERVDPRAGEIVDAESGEALGRHGGAVAFTVGQRRGLRLERPRADGAPRYVVGIEGSTVLVGPESLLAVDRVEGDRARWCGAPPLRGAALVAQVRAHGRELPCVVEHVGPDGTLGVRLLEHERGVASGQVLALYDGTRVVGSATITAARKHR